MNSRVITTSLILLLSFNSFGSDSLDQYIQEREAMKAIINHQVSSLDGSNFDLTEYGLTKGALQQCLLSPDNESVEAVEARLLMAIRIEILNAIVAKFGHDKFKMLNSYYDDYIKIIHSEIMKKQFELHDRIVQPENIYGDNPPIWMMQYLSYLLPDMLNGILTRNKIDDYINAYAKKNENVLTQEGIDFLKSIPLAIYYELAKEFKAQASQKVNDLLKDIGTHEKLMDIYNSDEFRHASIAHVLLRSIKECENEFLDLTDYVHSRMVNDTLHRLEVENKVQNINSKVRSMTGVTTTAQ